MAMEKVRLIYENDFENQAWDLKRKIKESKNYRRIK